MKVWNIRSKSVCTEAAPPLKLKLDPAGHTTATRWRNVASFLMTFDAVDAWEYVDADAD